MVFSLFIFSFFIFSLGFSISIISPVTTTNQAITALKLLRENKNKFDLVISDVHMPDMDGFKLLELVGLEMDLPVISNSSPSSFSLKILNMVGFLSVVSE